jgi:hypothetical protein
MLRYQLADIPDSFNPVANGHFAPNTAKAAA